MIVNYISIETLIEKISYINRDLWEISEIKEWVVEALTKLGSQEDKVELEKLITIENRVGKLPTNLEMLIDIKEINSGLFLEHIKYHTDFKAMTFKVKDGYLYTDFENGEVLLRYMALAVDDNDNPVIPDNHYYISAVISYIKFMIATKQYYSKEIVYQEMQLMERDWNYYALAVKSNNAIPDRNERKAFRKILSSNFPTIRR